ncbi:hypothetical protein QCA50_013211 [Cerrena zonata]|uniref:KEN domain-containing protein n=1 Tax=Cerrena zonata TaxID=2478898 RepID=A0AAW0FRA1_9APHY
MGCLFYYVLTNGGHPFGDVPEREMNILNNSKCLDDLESKEALHLISKLLSFDASERPESSAIHLHPYFWDTAKTLTFFQDVSDHLEALRPRRTHPILKKLEQDARDIADMDWSLQLDKSFVDTQGRRSAYTVNSIQDLLRVIRNSKHHYQELSSTAKEEIRPLPDGYLAYFIKRFPALIMHTYNLVASETLKGEVDLCVYFSSTD